jgi:hypothetical protein
MSDEKTLACSVLGRFLTGRLQLATLTEGLRSTEEPVGASIYSCKEVSRDLKELY